MDLHQLWLVIAALLPTAGVAFLFYIVIKAMIEGVVRAPSAFSITLGLLPSITATQLLVVPRSIPITLAMIVLLPFSCLQPAADPPHQARVAARSCPRAI